MLAVVLGAAVWAVIGAMTVAWLLVTLLERRGRLPGVVDVGRFFMTSFGGRLVVVAAWAEVGWHLFTQRP